MMPNLKILLHLVLLQVVCHFNVIVNGEWAGQVIQSQVTQVNPFKGLMTYYDADCEELTYGECYRGASPKPMPKDKAMAVEFFELPYQRVVNETKGLYNWTFFDRILKEISSRKRHAVVRFWDTYPGKKPGVPTYIRESKNYKELHLYNKEEGTWINYTDWSSREWYGAVI